MCGVAGAFLQPDGPGWCGRWSIASATAGRTPIGFTDLSPQTSVQLGHRRLSIIDLSTAADQPFVNDGLHLSYNGELYNYRELRNQLRSKGVRFRTESDTEVVLECWRHWGPAALPRFRGMFAFALYDERAAALTLVRDPLGIKPMYVLPRGSGIVFASELKALVAAVGPELTDRPGGARGVDAVLLPAGGTVRHQGGLQASTGIVGRVAGRRHHPVRSLLGAGRGSPGRRCRPEPRTWQRCSRSRSRRTWWPTCRWRPSSAAAWTRASLPRWPRAATPPSRRTRSRSVREDQRLEAMPDDAIYARKMAAHLGIRLHEIEISPDVVDMLPRVVDVLDEPIGDPAAINTVLMCQAAREAGVKVLLSGMGADELFGGYRKHLACLLGARYQTLPHALRYARGGPEREPAPGCGRGARTAVQPLGQALPQLRRAARGGGVPPQLHPLRPGRACRPARPGAGTAGADCCGRPSHACIPTTELTDHVNRMCLTDTRLFLPGLNLAYTDRSSMAASTEVRVPFVDPQVFRAAFSFRGSQKIKGRTQKVPLRAVAEDWMPRGYRRPPEGLIRRSAARLGHQRPRAADRRRPARRPAGVVGVSAPAAAAPDGDRSAQRPTGPIQAALAAALDGALVPRRSGLRGSRHLRRVAVADKARGKFV